MKKIMLLLCLLLMVYSVAADVATETIVPEQILAGNYFTFGLKITNTDTTSAQDITLELDGPHDFKVRDGEKTIQSLRAGESVTLQWSVKVNEDTPAGYYSFDVAIDENGDKSELSVPLLVRSLDTTLEITTVDVTPSSVEPGSEGEIRLDLSNHASYGLRDIHVLFNLENVPFAPRAGTEEILISQLEDEGSPSVNFDFTVLPTAIPGIYKIPVHMTYFDEFGKDYTKLNTVAVEVNAVPRLELFAEGNVQKGNTGDITLRIINQGLTPVQFLTVNLNHPAVVSAQALYIGDLQADDFQTEELSIFAEEDLLVIPVTLEFRDATNKNYIQERSLTVPVLTQEQVDKLGTSSSGIWLYIIIAVVLLVAGYKGWKYMRKKKNDA